jgi:ABC-type amino acid transport system permease subunit
MDAAEASDEYFIERNIFCQAMRWFAPWNEFIMLRKDTSLVSVVAVADLTRRGGCIRPST